MVKCLVTKQCLMVFGRQTFIVCPGLKVVEDVISSGQMLFRIKQNCKMNPFNSIQWIF